jgi:hypothetical protein
VRSAFRLQTWRTRCFVRDQLIVAVVGGEVGKDRHAGGILFFFGKFAKSIDGFFKQANYTISIRVRAAAGDTKNDDKMPIGMNLEEDAPCAHS